MSLVNLPLGAQQACQGNATYHQPNSGGGSLTDSAGHPIQVGDGQTITYPVFYRGPHGGSTLFTISGPDPFELTPVGSAATVVQQIATHPYSFGYVQFSNASVDPRVAALAIDGVGADATTVHNCDTGGSPCYPLTFKASVAMLKYGVNTARADTYARATDFIDQLLSPAGQAMVQGLGFVPIVDQVRILDADVNMDGVVDIGDAVLIGLSGTWSTSSDHPHWIRADVNRDGQVDIGDQSLIGIAENWHLSWSPPRK
jgi:hypothetical protein